MNGVHDLLGRDEERRRLAKLVGGVRNGRGAAVLVLGEPGIGKTALLEDATARAAGVETLRLNGYDAESTIPYAGVQRLTGPLRDHLASLPERQQSALRVAAGVATGPPPDRFLVGLGVLGLVTTAGTAGMPLVCVVDDAHLLDQESLEVLAFVARRIDVEPVGMLFAARDERDVVARLSGISDLGLKGLESEPAIRLLSRSLAEPVDPRAATRIAQATGGNPLALIDLAQDLSSQRLGELGLGEEPIPIGPQLEAHYVRRVRQADPSVQDWVLLAAADSTGSIDLVRSAAGSLDLAEETADWAELAGLVELADTVRFRHPLVRSAVYNAASGAERRRAHRALSAAAEQLGLVEQDAWHAAKATIGTDEVVATRLEHAADLAAARGGLASRASILARAAELSAPGPARTARLVGAAEAALAVGATATAQAHLDSVAEDSLDPVLRGRIIVLRCAITLFIPDGSTLFRASALLVEAADAFRGRDPEREQDALLHAFELYAVADRLAQGISQHELGRRLEAGAASKDGPYATILQGLAAVLLLPYDEALPRARAAFEEIERLPDHLMMTMGAAIGSLGMFLWDDAGRRRMLDQAAAAARDAGALQVLDTLMWVVSLAELWGGTVRRAVEGVDQVREVRRVMGYDAENVVNAAVMSWAGYPREVVHAIGEGAYAFGFGGVSASTTAALATRDLAEGSYASAYERLRPLVEMPFLHVGPSYYSDFVEAAVRSDHRDAASEVAARLAGLAEVNGSRWCEGVAQRSLALLDTGGDADRRFRAAIDHLSSTDAGVELGRAHLLYGEWLRRARRRTDASRELRVARDVLEQTGAEMFLPRVTSELEATGVAVKSTGRASAHDLTSQELTVARLAAAGQTNAAIGASLFISPNTVDYHLRKIFQKLRVSSRRQLSGLLGDSED